MYLPISLGGIVVVVIVLMLLGLGLTKNPAN